MRHEIVLAGLLSLILTAPALGREKRPPIKPARVDHDRYTVVVDRRVDRAAQIARELMAIDLLLTQLLDVPPERLGPPVTFVYLHRTRGMDRRLPFRGDRVGHAHLLPTDTRVWLLMREDTGLEKLPYATIQRTELALSGVYGDVPPWLRCGLFELLARASVSDGDLVLQPSSFPVLHQAGSIRAPLEPVAELGWSRYQEPRRWYTSILVTAFLFETAPEQLGRALADPSFSLVDAVDSEAFDAWVDRAVTESTDDPRVLIKGVDIAEIAPAALSEDQAEDVLVQLSMLHPRGPKAFRLTKAHRGPLAAAREELNGDGPGDACLALMSENTAEGLYTRGLCLWKDAPAAAEEAFRRAWRTDPAMIRAAVHAAALTLDGTGREADAQSLLDAAAAVTPADPDVALLSALVAARRGECNGFEHEDVLQVWAPIRTVEGPMEAYRDRFVREALECPGS